MIWSIVEAKNIIFEVNMVQMKYTAMACLVLLTTGCNLFKRKPKGPGPMPKEVVFFKEVSAPLLYTSLALDYKVYMNGTYRDFSVFPKTDKAGECDYLISGEQGYLRVTDSAAKFSRKYNNYFGRDSMILKDKSSIWLSELNYIELLKKGITTMETGKGGMDTFVITGQKFLAIPSDDSSVGLQVVQTMSKKYRYQVDFVADKNYPLIVNQSIGFKVSLEAAQMHESPYYNYVLGPKSVLRYRMQEFGVNEYIFTATNTLWTDSIVCFHIDGNYNGSPEYEFEYDVIFRNDAVRNPIFSPAIFSAMSGKIEQNKENFIFFRKNEIEALQNAGSGFLSVPHFAPSLSDGDTTGMDPADKESIQKNYDESYHTNFGLMRTGRLIHSGYYYNDDNSNEERILPSLSLRNRSLDFDLQVLNTGNFPLLLFYDDNFQWEINLEYAGYE